MCCGCASEKFVSDGKFLLTENKLYIDGEENQNHPIKQLILNKSNSSFFGFPIKMQLNHWAKEFPKKEFRKWLNKKAKRKSRTINLMSSKQVYQLEKYYIQFNSWLKKNGEPPILIDSLLINNNLRRIEQYYKNDGFFDVQSNYEIISVGQKKKEVNYNINLNQPYIISLFEQKIKSKDLKDLFVSNKSKSYLKPGEPFKIENIENERKRIIEMFRNNGVYNFQQNSVQFIAKIDSSGMDKNIDVILEINPIQKRIKDSLKEISYKRFKIDNSRRVKHTAIIDCELLSRVYVNLLDQKEPLLDFNNVDQSIKLKKEKNVLYCKKIIRPSEEEIRSHKVFIKNNLKKNYF